MQNLTNELVTVYMPTKDRPMLALRAVRSVLNQEYQNIELIIVIDGSNKEEYRDILKIKDTRLKVITNEVSKGSCFSRNQAIRSASGQFITGLDDDDYFESNRIKTLLKNFDPSFSFIFDSSATYKNGKRVNEPELEKIVDTSSILNTNIGNQVFTLTERLLEIGGFDESFISSQDYDLWTRLIIKYGNAKQIKASTYIYDIDHGFNRISTNIKAGKGAKQYFNKYKPLMNDQNIAHQNIRFTHYGIYPNLHDSWKVIKCFGSTIFCKSILRATYVKMHRLINHYTSL